MKDDQMEVIITKIINKRRFEMEIKGNKNEIAGYGEIPELLNELHDKSKLLNETIAELEKRLSGVSDHEKITESALIQKKENLKTALGNNIDAIIYEVETARQYVLSMIQRLEI